LVTVEDSGSGRGQLWTISYPDGKASRVTNDLSDYSSSIDLTRDEKTLATMVTSTVSNLWIAQATDLLHPLQATSGEPSLFQVRELSDGRLLALGDGVWTMNKDASDRLPFGQVQDARWIEPCGRSVLIAGNKDGTTDLTRFGLDGSDAAALASGDVLFPTCSPDGKFVYYMNFHHPEKIWRKPIDRGPPSAIADVLGSTLFGTLTISPDGKLLSYSYQQYSPPFVALAVIPADGGDPIHTFKVPGTLGRLRWSPDGNALQYLLTLGGATNLWEQPLNGGSAKQLTSFKTGQIFDFSWSRDRKRLLLARGQTTRDVVLIEDLDR
jgi:Tol biopolymer transport system component